MEPRRDRCGARSPAPMSRSNRKSAARRRTRFTGESLQQAHREIADLGDGQPPIPDTPHAAQQRVESAVLHRLVQGARAQRPAEAKSTFPLSVEAVCPTTSGLRLVVPVREVLAFGASLAMSQTATVRPPADAIAIRYVNNSVLSLTSVSAGTGMIRLRCSWNELRRAVEADPYVSVSSSVSLRFEASSAPQLSSDEHMAFSGLLRRIALFAEPGALDWLFNWHEWMMRGRIGAKPRLPDSLASDLTDKGFGLQPLQLRTLGIDGPPRWPTASGRRGSEDGDSGPTAHHEQTNPSARHALTAPAPRAPGAGATPSVEPGAHQDGQPLGTARRYNDLAITVMRLDPEYPIAREYHAMCFPSRWKEPLRWLAEASRGGLAARIPIASLNDAIAAVVPDCVVKRTYADDGDGADQDWLLAYHPVDPRAIFQLVTAWVRAQKATSADIESTLSQLSPDDLNWSSVRIGPDLPFSQLARLIPMEVANTLSRPDAKVPFGDLRFVRCPTNIGAELMSWPPERIENQEPFSVTIGISTQTVPFSSELLVYLSFGVRRWMPVRGNLKVGQSYPAYLAPTHPYLSGLAPSRHFGTAKIQIVRVPQEGGRNAWLPQWHQELARVLDRTGCLSQLPNPEQLVADPSELLRSGDAAALVYRHGMLPREKVSEGLPVGDRAQLMSWAIDELAPHLRPVEPLSRQKHTIYKGLATAAKGVIALDVLRDAIGPRLTVELLTDSDSTTQYALDRLGERLGVEFPRAYELGESETLLDFGSVTVGVRRITTPSKYADFKGDKPRPQAAVEAQVDLITELPGQATHPTIALVEISGQDRYAGTNRNADHRFALRHRLTHTGRLSQFVTPVVEARNSPRLNDNQESPDPNRPRFSVAIDDLFRQLGVRATALPPPAPNTLACQPALLAIWMIRQNNRSAGSVQQQVPVVVLADPTGRQVLVRTPEIAWQPLHVGLLDIGRKHGVGDRNYEPQDTMRFVREVIEDAVADYPDTLLLTHAQNLRGVWKFLANSHLEVDTVEFGNDLRQSIATLPGLRHVRVRTAERRETPECYGMNGDNIGQPTGLWRYLEPRLFGSTTGKPAVASSASIGVSKIESGMRNGKLTKLNPKAQVWNEQFVELCVAGIQDGDQPEHWAALAHNLRNAAPYSHWATALPWPLHLAKQIEEYIPWPDARTST